MSACFDHIRLIGFARLKQGECNTFNNPRLVLRCGVYHSSKAHTRDDRWNQKQMHDTIHKSSMVEHPELFLIREPYPCMAWNLRMCQNSKETKILSTLVGVVFFWSCGKWCVLTIPKTFMRNEQHISTFFISGWETPAVKLYGTSFSLEVWDKA